MARARQQPTPAPPPAKVLPLAAPMPGSTPWAGFDGGTWYKDGRLSDRVLARIRSSTATPAGESWGHWRPGGGFIIALKEAAGDDLAAYNDAHEALSLEIGGDAYAATAVREEWNPSGATYLAKLAPLRHWASKHSDADRLALVTQVLERAGVAP